MCTAQSEIEKSGRGLPFTMADIPIGALTGYELDSLRPSQWIREKNHPLAPFQILEHPESILTRLNRLVFPLSAHVVLFLWLKEWVITPNAPQVSVLATKNGCAPVDVTLKWVFNGMKCTGLRRNVSSSGDHEFELMNWQYLKHPRPGGRQSNFSCIVCVEWMALPFQSQWR